VSGRTIAEKKLAEVGGGTAGGLTQLPKAGFFSLVN
jgi:hypothetical protein